MARIYGEGDNGRERAMTSEIEENTRDEDESAESEKDRTEESEER